MASPGDREQRPSDPSGPSGGAWALRPARRFLASRQLTTIAVISAQAGLAAAAAWTVATHFLGRDAPVFAPVAALVTIASAGGQRTRQTVELLIGVGLGIIVSDGLLYFIGAGAWQTAVVVSSAIAVGLLVAGKSGALVSQAGATATLFATLAANQRDLELPRIIDTAVGASIGFLSVALLFPLNPLRAVDRAAEPLFATLAAATHTTARALADADRSLAMHALDRLDAATTDTRHLDEALAAADEVVTIAPWWRHLRRRYQRYRAAADQLDAFTTDLRVLTRRVAALLEDQKSVPPSLPRAVTILGDSLAHLHLDCLTGRSPENTRRAILEAARRTGQVDTHEIGMLADSVLVQTRSAASDLLRALGVTPEHAKQLVRDAASGADRTWERRAERDQDTDRQLRTGDDRTDGK